jgi:hypothetical protein
MMECFYDLPDDDGASVSNQPTAAETSGSALRDGIPSADYQQGVDAARSAAFRVLRALSVSDGVFYAVAGATYEVRGKRPLYGAQPEPTEVEIEIFRQSLAKAMETGTAKTEGLGAEHDSAVACDLPESVSLTGHPQGDK